MGVGMATMTVMTRMMGKRAMRMSPNPGRTTRMMKNLEKKMVTTLMTKMTTNPTTRTCSAASSVHGGCRAGSGTNEQHCSFQALPFNGARALWNSVA